MAENEQVNTSEAIQNVELTPTKPIPFELFAKKLNKTTRLVNNIQAESEMKGRNEWYNFPLEEPIFVSRIEIYADNYDYKNAEISWQPLRYPEPRSCKVEFQNGLFYSDINDLISGFSFRPDAKILGYGTIQRVVAHGYLLSELDLAMKQLSNLETARQSVVRVANETLGRAEEAKSLVTALTQKSADLKAEISEFSEESETAKNELARLQKNQEAVAKRTAEIRAEQSSTEARLEQQASTIEERTIERTKLNSEISSKKSELKDLISSLYMFPSELKEFAKKGSEDKAFYWKLSMIPVGVLTVLAFALLKNAADLTTIVNENDDARLLSIFITRIPFVVVAGALIGVMFKLANELISQIMRIDAQTRALAKISIVATDVSAASAEKLDLDEEEVYHLRTGLKMDLLREHLKTYISEDYNYLGSTRVSSRLERAKERFSKKKEADQAELEDMKDSLADQEQKES